MDIKSVVSIINSLSRLQSKYKDYYTARYCAPLYAIYLEEVYEQGCNPFISPDTSTLCNKLKTDRIGIVFSHELLRDNKLIKSINDYDNLVLIEIIGIGAVS